MRGFRFRAQPALDLRRREDDEAQRVLARAEAGLRAAMSHLQQAEQRVEEARAQWAESVRQAGAVAQQLWYRSWILRLERERDASAAAMKIREAEQARAAAERARTLQRVKALERFKEKSARAWAQRLAAEEQKHLDALATIRFFTASRQKDDETGANG